MFWKLTSLSATSPVESILDKDDFTLEELLDEEEIIQECRALNSRLINFLRDRAQVKQLLRYIVEEPPQDADSKREFKFPFISSEIFTCEIDVILKTLVEEEELMDVLFSFLEPSRPHSTSVAGYFSKVVICLMSRKTIPLMSYVQAHQNVFCQLVDLIGITSIMEVLIRLVGADDHVYPNFMDVMNWLADSDLLEMIVDKLSSSSSPVVQANAAETLCAITRNAPSALATKLSSPSFVAKVFDHALEDSSSSSGLVHSLSVCISLLDPRKSAVSLPLFHSFRGQHMFESPVPVDQDTINAMLPKLGDLLILLNGTSYEKVLPTTYGALRPPLGKHRLKIVEYIAVLLKTGNEAAEKELVTSGMILRVLDLFFEYPFNNALHHHVESVVLSCLESKNEAVVDHLLREFNLIEKFLQTDKNPVVSAENQPTSPAAEKKPPRAGNVGHITRISNKLAQLANNNSQIKACLEGNDEWSEWQANVLQERNLVENVYRWACGRPTALQDRMRNSDEDDLHDRDYDIAALANNLSQAFRNKIYENDDNEEDRSAPDRDGQDVYFDDESAEVVISSIRPGDDQGSLFTNSNWFTFQEDRFGNTSSDIMDNVNLNDTSNAVDSSSSSDGVMVGEDGDLTHKSDDSPNGNTSTSETIPSSLTNDKDMNPQNEYPKFSSHDFGFFGFDSSQDQLSERSSEWVGWGEPSDKDLNGSSSNPFLDHNDVNLDVPMPDVKNADSGVQTAMDKGDSSRSPRVPSLFEEAVEFVGVEPEGTEKAMEQALKEGVVGEAGPLKKNVVQKVPETETAEENLGMKEYNDANYWRVEQQVTVLE